MSGRDYKRRIFTLPNTSSTQASLVMPRRALITSITYVMQNSAVVGNRQSTIDVTDQNNTRRAVFVVSTNLSASASAVICLAPDLTQSAIVSGTSVTVNAPMPDDFVVEEGDTVQISYSNDQAGDVIETVTVCAVVLPIAE